MVFVGLKSEVLVGVTAHQYHEVLLGDEEVKMTVNDI